MKGEQLSLFFLRPRRHDQTSSSNRALNATKTKEFSARVQWESSRSSGCRAYPVYKSAIPFWETVFSKKEDGGVYWVVREWEERLQSWVQKCHPNRWRSQGSCEQNKKGRGSGRTQGSRTDTWVIRERWWRRTEAVSGGRESERERAEKLRKSRSLSPSQSQSQQRLQFSLPPFFLWTATTNNESPTGNSGRVDGSRRCRPKIRPMFRSNVMWSNWRIDPINVRFLRSLLYNFSSD